MTALTLHERLAALRLDTASKADAANVSPVSEVTTPHNLYTFLQLYNKANKECYINYMEGASYLLGYLTSGGIAPLEVPEDLLVKYPQIANPAYKLSNIVAGYERSELATLISSRTYGDDYHYWYKAIYFAACELIQRGLI